MEKKKVHFAVIEALSNCDAVSLHHRYSGRGMCGEQCFGFSAGNIPQALGEVFDFLTDFGREPVLELCAMLQESRLDSMGMGMIVYFPGYESGIETEDTEEE